MKHPGLMEIVLRLLVAKSCEPKGMLKPELCVWMCRRGCTHVWACVSCGSFRKNKHRATPRQIQGHKFGSYAELCQGTPPPSSNSETSKAVANATSCYPQAILCWLMVVQKVSRGCFQENADLTHARHALQVPPPPRPTPLAPRRRPRRKCSMPRPRSVGA